MINLTEARREVTRAVSALRARGCKISGTVGHDPASGRYLFSITLPSGIHVSPTGRPTPVRHAAVSSALSDAWIGISRMGEYIQVRAAPTPKRIPTPAAERIDLALNVAAALREVLRRIEAFDTTSSVSSQHFIDTGYYLTTEDLGKGARRSITTLTLDQVSGLRDLLDQYDDEDKGGVSLGLCEAFAEQVREVLA